MKKFRNWVILIATLIIAVAVSANLYILKSGASQKNKAYIADVNGIREAIKVYEKENGTAVADLTDLKDYIKVECSYITGVKSAPKAEIERVEGIQGQYVILTTDDYVYRIDYNYGSDNSYKVLWITDIIILVVIVIFIIAGFYVYYTVLKPFNDLTDLPYELSKGNLTMPLVESKNRYFGKYIWGMNLLREQLENNKEKELALIKDKKLVMLSLSHDIKTPLSAIKLYSSAILKRIYKEESKIINVAENIGEKVREIEKYLSEIISASNDDFMNLSVDCRDIYSSDVLGQVIDYYNPKMELNNITFEKEIKGNTLIKADGDRLVEVLQNIIENAIKYGDGRYIGMSACREEEEYLITVENTGCELTDAEAVHIFDSFYRGSNVGNQPGSGLGLYICRKLIHAMEGEIFAEIKEDADGRKMCIKIVMRLA